MTLSDEFRKAALRPGLPVSQWMEHSWMPYGDAWQQLSSLMPLDESIAFSSATNTERRMYFLFLAEACE